MRIEVPNIVQMEKDATSLRPPYLAEKKVPLIIYFYWKKNPDTCEFSADHGGGIFNELKNISSY